MGYEKKKLTETTSQGKFFKIFNKWKNERFTLHVIHCIDVGNAALPKYQVSQVSKSKGTLAMILRLLRMTVYKKTCILCCCDGWLWPQICKQEKLYIIVQTNCHASTGKSHDKC
jgi:hypothetical protein